MTTNPFAPFWAAGYTRLIPIVPPDATLSEHSSLAKRKKDPRGKAPGVRKDNGDWIGLEWIKHATTEADLVRWADMGAGVGLKTGQGLLALDIDILDADLAGQCIAWADLNLGAAPLRVGRPPKALLLYATADDVPYHRVKCDHGAVELLADGRQFVAFGVHPDTRKPYTWPDGLWPREKLTIVTAAQVDAFFAFLTSRLPGALRDTGTLHTERSSTDQSQLLGDPVTVAAAVACLPNTNAIAATRDDYIRVGYAIKGATQDEDAGLELFQDWAARWTDGENDPQTVEADWARMKPPYSIGAQFLYSLAERHSEGRFRAAETWFDEQVPTNANPFDEAPAEAASEALEPIRWADLTVWAAKEAPPREWEVADFIPRGLVTLLYGEGGVGKTLAAHQYAVCAAAGLDWLGQKTRPARVMCVFCEDEDDELHRRHRAILKACGVDGSELADRLRIVSRAGEDNLLVTFSRSNNTMQKTAFWHQLQREVEAWRADVLILDTIADIYGGSEIDRAHVNAFVKVGLAGLGAAVKASTVALGHPSVAGRAEGRSGSTAWSNASRSRLYLRRPKGKEKSNLRELEGMKANRTAMGSLLQIKWQAGAFALVAESKPIDLEPLKKEAVAGAVPRSLEEMEERAVLAALHQARRDSLPLGLSARAHQKYAPRVLRATYPDIMEHVRAEDDVVESIMRGLLRAGRIAEASWRHPGHRYLVSGFEVSADTSVFH